MTDARQNFAHLLDFLAAIDDGRPPRPEVREWFLAGCDAWARSASTKPLHEHLGLSRRLRRDYLQARLADYLDEALRAFAETHKGSAWDLSAAFVAELKRFERQADRDPGTSRLQRSLWLAFHVGLPVPMSREHWFSKLKTIGVDGSVNIAPNGEHEQVPSDLSDQGNDMTSHRTPKGPVHCKTAEDVRIAHIAGYLDDEIIFEPASNSQGAPATDATKVEAQARREWQEDSELRADFGDNQEGFEAFLAYKRATAAGLVKTFGARK